MVNTLPIFVSHSHNDSVFCQALVSALRGAGADVWYDEQDMGAGQLMDVIQKELGRRKIFIVILSKDAFASNWVQRETIWAYKLYVRDSTRVILPVTARQIDLADFDPEAGWLFLEDFKRIEARDYQPFTQAEAIDHILHVLSLTPIGESPAPTAPQHTEGVGDLITCGNTLMQDGQKKHSDEYWNRYANEFAPKPPIKLRHTHKIGEFRCPNCRSHSSWLLRTYRNWIKYSPDGAR